MSTLKPFPNELRDTAAPGPQLVPFLALSALLHAALLALLPSFAASPTVPLLHLALAPPTQPTPAVARVSSPPPPSPAAPARKSTPLPAQHEPQALAPLLPSMDTSSLASAEQAAEPSDAVVLTQVHAALMRYFSYPLLARRQGWQGEVLLGFSLSPEGHIAHVQVVRSSGHRLLDEAARASLARVGNLPNYTVVGGEARQLQLPVVYRLAEG